MLSCQNDYIESIVFNNKWTNDSVIDDMIYEMLEDATLSFDFFDDIDFTIKEDCIYFGFGAECEGDICCILRIDEDGIFQYCGNFLIEQDDLDDFYNRHKKLCEKIFL